MELLPPAFVDRAFPYVGRLLLAYWAAYAGVVSSIEATTGRFSVGDLNPLLPVLVCTSHPLFLTLAMPPMIFGLLYVVRRWPWWLASGIAVYSSCVLTWIMTELTKGGL